jgi:hypothetical protein
VVLLGGVVAHVDLGAKLHLLDLDLDLLLAGGLGLAVLLILELAIVHDLADRRLRVGSDLHEVEVLLVGDALGVANAEQTKLGTIDADQAAGTRVDLVVDARTLVLGYLLHLPSSVPHGIKKLPQPCQPRRQTPPVVGNSSLDQTAALGAV